MRGYYTIARVTDFGPRITKIVLPMDEEINEKNVDATKFSVYVERLDKHGDILMVQESFFEPEKVHPSKGYVGVTAAYPSDLQGNKLSNGNNITLELEYGPIYPLSTMLFLAEGGHEYFAQNCYTITQIAEIKTEGEPIVGLMYDNKLEEIMTDTDGWIDSVSHYEKQPIRYGYFVPESKQQKKPLIVWLHGAGEGGKETRVAYAGNKVVNLSKDWIQDYFGGAYILAPQTETYWMDDGAGIISESGKSIYVDGLKACIDEFVGNHSDIDTDRIYIGGDSNGGFMTMRMIIDFPDYFAAAFPICEALADEAVSDEDIESIKNIPIWFTHCVKDPLVKIDRFMLNTYKRLVKAGGENIHLTLWDKIEDIHEGFKDEKGNPYEYFAHFAWIPVLNDDCRLDYDNKPVFYNGKEVTLLQWLALQHK